MKINAQVEITLITPKIASEWLNHRWEGQRNVRQNHVKRLASDMVSGRWKLSPDCILRILGSLANGQHRLEAIVATGIPQNMIVMESKDEELYKVIDAGLKRTVADGLGNNEYTKTIPAIARWVQAYDKSQISIRNRTASALSKNEYGSFPTQVELIDYCIDNREILLEAARVTMPLYMKTRILPQSIAGAIYVLGNNINQKEAAQKFLSNIYDGGSNHSATMLRNRLIASRGSRIKMDKGHLFALTIKSFNYFMQNRAVGCLRIQPDEDFPSLIG
jgi:hypothetical protein